MSLRKVNSYGFMLFELTKNRIQAFECCKYEIDDLVELQQGFDTHIFSRNPIVEISVTVEISDESL